MIPYYNQSGITLYHGHVLDVLRELPDESVDCCVTSPPYWGLRDYGLPSSIWGGDVGCEHEWFGVVKHRTAGGPQVAPTKWQSLESVATAQQDTKSDFCSVCGAWRGCLGLEPSYKLYIEHLVIIFQEIRRVLKPEGTAWLNLGDCYATGAGKVGDHPGGGAQGERWSGYRGAHGDSPKHKTGAIGPMTQPNRMPQDGLKPKDLCMIPHRAAIALQEAGWWVRSDICWAKPAPMPESVEDRPTRSHEYIFCSPRVKRTTMITKRSKNLQSAGIHLAIRETRA